MEEPTEQWEHAGLQCELRPTLVYGGAPIIGGPFNGYVKVPATHPHAKSSYDEVPVDVHGGLTYSKTDDDGGTWFGWDDCHAWRLDGTAKDETSRLAEQLAKLGKRPGIGLELLSPEKAQQ
jgi:hypothetical protein